MLKLVKTHSKVVNAENKRQFHHFIKVVSEFLFGHLKFHLVVPENLGKSTHLYVQQRRGFITLICFGLSMWIHLSFLQTYFFLNFYTRYNEKKKTYNWSLMIYTLKRRNAATKVVILFLVIQSNTVSYILKMMLMKKYTKMVEVMELLIRHYFDI